MFEGAHPETHVFTISTMYCGIPGLGYLLCEMLMSHFEQTPVQEFIHLREGERVRERERN